MTSDHNGGHGVNRRKICIATALATVLAAAVTFPGATFPVGLAQVADAAVNIDQFTVTPRRVIVKAGTTSGKTISSSGRAGKKEWIELHRPDGEVVHVKADQIVFVTSATGTGASMRANSKLQLLNGYSDVRESVEEVMQAIHNDDSLTW